MREFDHRFYFNITIGCTCTTTATARCVKLTSVYILYMMNNELLLRTTNNNNNKKLLLALLLLLLGSSAEFDLLLVLNACVVFKYIPIYFIGIISIINKFCYNIIYFY